MAKITILIGPVPEFSYRIKKARVASHLSQGCDMTLARGTGDEATAKGAAMLVAGSDGLPLCIAAQDTDEALLFAAVARTHGAEVDVVDAPSPDRAATVSAVA